MPAPNHEPSSPRVAVHAESDVQLATSAGAGNAMAFETIVRRHNRLLFRTARGVVPDDAEAQDVVQETYLRAFTNLRAYRGDSSLGTWLARIAINVALSSRRKKGRLIQLEDAVPSADAADPEEAMTLHTPDNEGPDARAERQEMRDSKIVWNARSLDHFLQDERFGLGLSAQDINDLAQYLKSL